MIKKSSFYVIIYSMKIKVKPHLVDLATKLNSPLYVVGGYVRNYLIDNSISKDVDLSANIPTKDLCEVLCSQGFIVHSIYKNTGTVKFSKEGCTYEYTRFRTDNYRAGGAHTPDSTTFTDDIKKDALRRDFKCNAIYYDVLNDEVIDVLGGIKDVQNKTLSTVTDARTVFSSDGLRLMRLARFSGELGFTPNDDAIKGATEFACNIKDISPERIYDELKKILLADKKYAFSPDNGHYLGLKVLERTGVLDIVIPELTLGKNMPQRKDFHDYDVLEHSLRCALYAEPEVRFDALLHDVGKPFCLKRDNAYKLHDKEGVWIADNILSRLKAPKKDVERIKFCIGTHMLDLKNDMTEKEIRKFIVKNPKYLQELFWVRQADYSACKDDTRENAGVKKWKKILGKMIAEGVPFTHKGLKVSAEELINVGIEKKNLKNTFDFLLENVAVSPDQNEKGALIKHALSFNCH